MKNRKGQLKVQEMSFMLLALVLFFIIAGLFFVIITNANLKKDAEFLKKQNAISSVEFLADSPELSCGKSLCIDVDKVFAIKDNDAFNDFWELDGLVIKKLFPLSEGDYECGLGNYPNCAKITLKQPPKEGYTEVSSFVVLCSKEVKNSYVYDNCFLGKISAYIKKGVETIK